MDAGQIGVSAQLIQVYKNLSIGKSAQLAITLPYQITTAQLVGLADLVKNRNTEGIGGPVMMGKMVAEAAQSGVPAFLWMLMFISVALGMFNLLPFPALDGGRLIFLGYELLTRKRANEQFETAVHAFGIMFLLRHHDPGHVPRHLWVVPQGYHSQRTIRINGRSPPDGNPRRRWSASVQRRLFNWPKKKPESSVDHFRHGILPASLTRR